MKPLVAPILALTLLISACLSSNSPENSESYPATPTAASTSVAVPQIPSTAIASEIPNPTPVVELRLPPSGEYLDRLDVGEAGIYALTIDDGFGQMPFDDILNELNARNIQATFFLVAQASMNLGYERMERLAEEGHTIAYHSYSHDDLPLVEEWDEQDWLADYLAWEDAMRLLLGDDLFTQTVRPYARAPFGLFNLPFLGMTDEIGLIPVGWSRDPGDLNVGLTVRPGDIFLLHVRYPDAELLPGLLDEIDLRPVSLDELFAAWKPE